MHFDPKKYTQNYKMRVIQNKEDMINYYQLKKIRENRDVPNLRRNWAKVFQIGKNLYYVHFETKKYIKI